MADKDERTTGAFNLELFFELSLDLLCVAGFDGYFKRINPTVSKTLGYTNEELFSRPINDFIHPDDRITTEGNRNNLRSNEPLLNFENRYITKSGEIVWLSWTSMPIESERVVFAIAKNITHKRRLDDERNQQLARLTRANNDLKQLNYTASHDMRSPVNNLLAIFSMLDRHQVEDEMLAELLSMLRLATENLKNTLNTHIDELTGREELNIRSEEVDLQECLDVVIKSIKTLVTDSKVVINADFTEVPVVPFNKSYMESVFLNLVTNSIKYARPEALPIVNICSQRAGGLCQLTFADNGMGFDLEKVGSRIFGFHQTFGHHSDSKGIGLYLVYNHINNLGGHITLDSKLGEGSTFTITF